MAPRKLHAHPLYLDLEKARLLDNAGGGVMSARTPEEIRREAQRALTRRIFGTAIPRYHAKEMHHGQV